MAGNYVRTAGLPVTVRGGNQTMLQPLVSRVWFVEH